MTQKLLKESEKADGASISEGDSFISVFQQHRGSTSKPVGATISLKKKKSYTPSGFDAFSVIESVNEK